MREKHSRKVDVDEAFWMCHECTTQEGCGLLRFPTLTCCNESRERDKHLMKKSSRRASKKMFLMTFFYNAHTHS